MHLHCIKDLRVVDETYMTVKFIQVNAYMGKYLDELVDFLKSEDPDFISMQEVTTNDFNLCSNKDISLFEYFSDKLKMHGEFNGDLKLAGHPDSVFGNAVFSRFPVIHRKVVVLKSFRPLTLAELSGDSGEFREQIDRHLLDAQISINGKLMHVLCWHGAWTAPPHDTDETSRQADIVYDYMRTINEPFILGGDLNAIIGSKTVNLMSTIANNVMLNSKVSMTTNPKVHKIAPRGYLIDFIFTSQDIRLIDLTVPEITVSDHLPVIAWLEIG